MPRPTTPTVNEKENSPSQIGDESSTPTKRGSKFWLIFVANLVVDLLSALDLTAVSTALPTIVGHLHGSNFIWVGSAYAIASTAILPTVGVLASTLGRKPILLAFISCFAVGSAICGSAQSMNMLIAGRVIQGLGGGGCISVTEIIYADLVPLPERGKFLGITASVWAFACSVGPPIGGALARSGSWRWLFFLNIPLCAVAFILVLLFLNIRTPRKGLGEMLAKIDWVGLFTIISSTVSISIALNWGGIQHAWSSAQVLVPIVLGGVGLIAFFLVEFKYAEMPTVPPFIITNRTTLSGYIGTFIHGIVSMSVIFYLPVYFQASKLASPVRSGVDLFGLAIVIPPVSIITGISVQLLNRYRPQNYLGWIFTIVGFGLLTTLDANSPKAKYVGYQVVLAIGLGIVWIGTQFPILAPLPFSNNAHALAFFTFLRCFAQTWGTVSGGAILQNILRSQLPAAFLARFDNESQLIYAIIPQIQGLPAELQAEVQQVFSKATRIIWFTMMGISILGLLSCFLMQEIEMRKALDDAWGLADGETQARSQNPHENSELGGREVEF